MIRLFAPLYFVGDEPDDIVGYIADSSNTLAAVVLAARLDQEEPLIERETILCSSRRWLVTAERYVCPWQAYPAVQRSFAPECHSAVFNLHGGDGMLLMNTGFPAGNGVFVTTDLTINIDPEKASK